MTNLTQLSLNRSSSVKFKRGRATLKRAGKNKVRMRGRMIISLTLFFLHLFSSDRFKGLILRDFMVEINCFLLFDGNSRNKDQFDNLHSISHFTQGRPVTLRQAF